MYPFYGDHRDAWAPANPGGREWLELKFRIPIFITAMDIYETFNCGCIVKISVKSSHNHSKFITIYEGKQLISPNQSRIWKPQLDTSVNVLNIIFNKK